MKQVNVVSIGNKFAVQFLFCDGSDEMIEVLTHSARFAYHQNAERLAAQVRKQVFSGGFINPAHWEWYPTPCSPFVFIHTAPTAKPYDVLGEVAPSLHWVD